MSILAKACVIGTMLLGTSFNVLAVDGSLTLYTSQPNNDAQQTIDAFTEIHPDVSVSFVRDGTTKLMARLRAEIQTGITPADILLIADSVTMEGMAADNLLLTHADADVSAYDPGIQDSDRPWFPTKLITTGIICYVIQ